MEFKAIIPSYHPLTRMQRDFNQLFDNLFHSSEIAKGSSSSLFHPSLDMEETDKEIHLHLELAGLDEKDISIELKEGILSIRGEKKLNRSESGKNFHIIERSSGSFVRNIELPAHLIQEDKIEASFKNGVLLIRIPKSDHVLQEAKKIPISTS